MSTETRAECWQNKKIQAVYKLTNGPEKGGKRHEESHSQSSRSSYGMFQHLAERFKCIFYPIK